MVRKSLCKFLFKYLLEKCSLPLFALLLTKLDEHTYWVCLMVDFDTCNHKSQLYSVKYEKDTFYLRKQRSKKLNCNNFIYYNI